MDPAYAAKLEQAANAPDSAFPSMLFAPLMNDFGDLYFKLGAEDYENAAVKVDPRFTARNIRRLRGATKRIDVYLELLALWEDYMAYIKSKYGSIEMARELEERGLIEDILPSIDHPPMLKKGKSRRLFFKGFVPSFIPHGVDPNDGFHYMKALYDDDPIDDELVIVTDDDKSLSKEEREILAKNAERYRRQMRVELLASGSSVSGISSNVDFVDNYYVNMRRGAYDSLSSTGGEFTSMAEGYKRYQDKLFRHQGQIIEDERAARGETTGMSYDGSYIIDKRKLADATILGHLQKYAGIDLINAAANAGMKKGAIRGIRSQLNAVGATVGMTEKERKKYEKKMRKLNRAQASTERADARLQDILLNNKVFLNGGTVRFEDGMPIRRRDWD